MNNIIFCNSRTEPIFKKMFEDWYNGEGNKPHIIGWNGGEPIYNKEETNNGFKLPHKEDF